MHPVFDGHNDVLSRLWESANEGRDPVTEFRDGTDQGHIDGPRARQGGLVGGLCAMFVSSGPLVMGNTGENGHYEFKLSDGVERSKALDIALEMTAIALRLDRGGHWKLCRSTGDIRAAMDEGIFAAVLHLEGCEPIGADLSALETFYAAGLRSLGPVWSRHNVFGHGVPFAFPKSPDTAPGLTDAGFALIGECDRLGVAIDLAHITEKGFWDVAKTSTKPLIVSHSNAHALTPVARNLTDRQLDAVRERRGIVGLNYATTMLRPDGQDSVDTPLSDMVRHIDYLVDRLGIDCVGLGSDFDGATIPSVIGDAAGNQKLVAALEEAGYGEAELEKMCRENWLRVLGEAWHE